MKLTNTRIAIIKAVREGLSNAEIADKVCLSEKAVKWHLYEMYKAWGFKNKVDLAMNWKQKIPHEAYL